MAYDPLDELKRRRSGALAPVSDPLEELKRRRSLMENTTLSPLMEENPFAVKRESLPLGPRRSQPLPAVVTTAEAPKKLEQRLGSAIREGSLKAEPFGTFEEMTPEQQRQALRARSVFEIAEDVGRAVGGQPERTVYRMATGIANLRGDPRAARLAERATEIEEATAPRTGIGKAARLVSEIGAFIPSGLTMGALRSGVESAAGKEYSTAEMLSGMVGGPGFESPVARAVADAALDLAIPGALAARRGVRSVREAQRGIGDAFTLGMREGAGEAVEAATPSLARRDGFAPRATPETDPARLLPSRTSQTIPSFAEPPLRGDPGAMLPARPMPARTPLPPTPTERLEQLAQQAQAARQAQASGIEVIPGLEPRTAQRQRKLRRESAQSLQQIQADIDDRRALAMPDMEATSQLEAIAEAGRRQRAQAPKSPILQFLSEEAGAITPAAAGQIATTGVGAAGGAAIGAQQEELGGTALQRALAGAVAGGALATGGKYGVSRLMREKAPAAPRGSTPALQFINEGISVGPRETREADRLLSRFERFKTQVVSETLPLERAAEVAGGAQARQQVGERIAQMQGAGQSAKRYLKDRITPVVKGLNDTELDDARALLKARRLLNITEKGGAAKGAGDPELWRQAISEAEANPRVKAAADAVNEMHRDLLEMRYKSGLLTDDEYQKILASDDFYTPFVKDIAEDMTTTPKLTLPDAKTGGVNVSGKGVQRMERDVETLTNTADPFEVASISAARTFLDTRKQEVVNTLMEMADAGALPFVRQVKGDPTQPLRANQFKQIRNGKTRIYAVDDPDLFQAIAGQSKQAQFFGLKFAQALKGLKTAGIVLNPVFALGNIIRDVGASGIQRPDFARALGREGLPTALAGGTFEAARGEERDLEGMAKNFLRGAGFGLGAGMYARPMLQTLKAAGDIALGDKDLFRRFFNDADYQEFLRKGGSTEGFYVRSPDDAQRVLRELRNQKVDLKTIVNPKSWVDALRFIGSVGEQSTRLAAYRQAIAAGKTPLQAVVDAQDRTLRFANIGAGTKTLASMTPFWNTKVQGWDKLGRLLKDPKTYAAGTTMITAPTMALWSVNKDNPDYWDRPQWERNLFWLVPIPDSKDFFRVPKPFELGYVFASLPERMLDYAAERGLIESAAPQSATPGRALTRAVTDMATSTFEGTLPAPQVFALPGQLAANYDLFRNRKIATRQDLPTEMQGGPETSALARALSRIGVSPEKTDFVIRDVFGTAGEEGLKLSTAAARAMGADLPESNQPAPITGMLARRFITQERGQSEPEIAARDRMEQLAKVRAGLREKEKGGDERAIMQYMGKNLRELDLYDELKPLQDMLDNEVAMRREVERDPALTKEERQAMLADIRKRTIDISRMIIETKDKTP